MPDVVQRAEPARLLYTIAETETLLSISHAQLYKLIRLGRIEARKIGRRTVIPTASIDSFLAALPKLDSAPKAA